MEELTDPEVHLAVLWLILLSGASIKWAHLGTRQERLFSVAQLFLTTGLAFLVVVTMILRKSHVDCMLQVTSKTPPTVLGQSRASGMWSEHAVMT